MYWRRQSFIGVSVGPFQTSLERDKIMELKKTYRDLVRTHCVLMVALMEVRIDLMMDHRGLMTTMVWIGLGCRCSFKGRMRLLRGTGCGS